MVQIFFKYWNTSTLWCSKKPLILPLLNRAQQSCLAQMRKDEGVLDLRRPARELHNRVRASRRVARHHTALLAGRCAARGASLSPCTRQGYTAICCFTHHCLVYVLWAQRECLTHSNQLHGTTSSSSQVGCDADATDVKSCAETAGDMVVWLCRREGEPTSRRQPEGVVSLCSTL